MKLDMGFSSYFKRAIRKRIYKRKELESKFIDKLNKFRDNPFDPVLRTHKLSGELEGLWSFSIEYKELFLSF